MELRIEDVLKDMQPKYRVVIRIALESMKRINGRGTYSEYFPGFIWSKSVVGFVSDALWDFWCYCEEKEIVWLNMLIIRKDTGWSGDGVLKWYSDEFKTAEGYGKFCENRANLAEAALINKTIVIV